MFSDFAGSFQTALVTIRRRRHHYSWTGSGRGASKKRQNAGFKFYSVIPPTTARPPLSLPSSHLPPTTWASFFHLVYKRDGKREEESEILSLNEV